MKNIYFMLLMALAIISITIIQCMALSVGINGIGLSASMLGIGSISGYAYKHYDNKMRSEVK